MEHKSHLRRCSEIPKSKNNVFVEADDALIEYAKSIAHQKWDPDTPRLTQEEKDFLLRTEKMKIADIP